MINYRGYTIEPKRDFKQGGLRADGSLTKIGYIVVKGGCNVVPGATWFHTIENAKEAIDILISVDGDGDQFWQRFWQRLRGASQ